MDTSGLKPFAQTMRITLMQGVEQRLRYWGFADGPTPTHTVEPIEGGYLFRNETSSDPTVPKKWAALKKAVQTHGVEAVQEEAASTWFNRLMALRILEKNNHESTVLGYAPDTREPRLLYNARQGIVPHGTDRQRAQVNDALDAGNDNAAFRTLLLAYYADHTLLNDVFGRVQDFTALLLPTALLDEDGPIEQLVTTTAISDDDYAQVELIGWLYQFYISEKKDAVYDKSGKFEPEDIPAATQIFTPRWIVRYMVENTIGKQWLEQYPDSPLRQEMDYLVQADAEERANGATEGRNEHTADQGAEGTQAEAFTSDQAPNPKSKIGNPKSQIQNLKLFDPAAGSGHILVQGFDLLMQMYRERGYTDRQAVTHILTENLKGLDIDRRAAQLARFALLMKAATYDARILQRDVRPEVYPMPEPRSFSDADLRAYFDDEVFHAHGEAIQEALTLMAEHGQNVGSALKLDLSDDARTAMAREMAHWADQDEGTADLMEQELVHELNAYLKPLLMLTGTYPAVAANPPYASNRNINKPLKDYLKNHYPDAKRDLFATFMKVLPGHTAPGGRFAFITPPSWMFLSSYEDLRRQYIDDFFFDSLLHLSRGIFGADFGSVATAIQKAPQQGRTGTYFRLIERTFQEFHVRHLHDLFRRAMEDPDFRYDFSEYEKDGSIPETSDPDGQQLFHPNVDQRDFEKIPGAPIAYWVPESVITAFEDNPRLAEIGKPRQGMATSDNKRFLRVWSEVSKNQFGVGYRSRSEARKNGCKWFPYNKGGGYQKWYGNLEFVVNWEDNGREIKKFDRSVVRNEDYYFKEGITWSFVSSGDFGVRYAPQGLIFDVGGSSLFPDQDLIPYTAAFLNSRVAFYDLKVLNPTMNFQVGNLASLPFKVASGEQRRRIDELSEASIELAKTDFDARETSWDFTQHPLIQQNAASLEAAYDAWKAQATDDFLQLHANEEKLNELFIDLYGLQDELSPHVDLGDITILDDELDWDAIDALEAERDTLSDDALRTRLLEDDPEQAPFKMEVPIRQLLSYGIGVMMGRYRLGHDGLHIAHPAPTKEERAPYDVPTPLCAPAPNTTEPFAIDDDGIVPLMGTDSPFSDDAVYRMREILRLLWGEDQETETLNFINRALSVGRGRGLQRSYEKTMEEWLVGDFYDYHKKLYSVPYYGKKPIYWLFQSPEGHFQVLVYMHRMTKYTVQQVRQNYLHTYQDHLGSEIAALEAQSDRTAAATKRLDRLHEHADDARTYDAILKDIANQQIEIDLDDGVQNNYPKFGDALAAL